jgi:uncharacterized protein (DUF1800 family)
MMNRRSFLKISGNAAAAGAMLPTLAIAQEAEKKIKKKKIEQAGDRPFAQFIYQRMGFGPTAEQLKLGLQSREPFHFEKYVETQLHPEKIKDELCEQKIKEADLTSLNKTLKECWNDYKIAADELKKSDDKNPEKNRDKNGDKRGDPKNSAKKTPEKRNENELRQTPIRELEAATWIRAIYSEKQLQEVIVQFWHDHFSVNGWDQTISPTMIHYDSEVIRKHAFGNFRDMVQAVTQSPAMLLYLDNGLNQSANPNENFARELFELHTLGAENYLGTLDRKRVLGFSFGKSKGYVDGDVYESARAFTGWRENSNQKDATNTGEFSYYDAWHDRFQKIILGHSLPELQPPEKDGLDVIALISKHEGTAHSICKKLCRKLVSDHPSEALINKAKHVFLTHQKDSDQLRKGVRTILLSPDFRDATNVKLKRPFEYAVSLIRSLKSADHQFLPTKDFLNQQNGSGQRLFQWKSPDGYPDIKERWMTSSGLLCRFQLANMLFDQKIISLDEFRPDENPVAGIQSKIIGYSSTSQTQIMNDFIKDHEPGLGKPLPQPILKGLTLLALMSPELQWK